jgi:hypothetical protein
MSEKGGDSGGEEGFDEHEHSQDMEDNMVSAGLI